MSKHAIAIARAVGVIGATAAVMIGISFANNQSNTVQLSPNTLVSASATVAIAAGTNCPAGNTGTIPGFTSVHLVPGVASSPVPFCLYNTGDIPLSMTAQIPAADFTGSQIPPTDVTLTLTCPSIGTLSGTLDQYASPASFPGSQLATATPEDCNATATLSSSFSGSTSQSVNSFDIDFVGNQ